MPAASSRGARHVPVIRSTAASQTAATPSRWSASTAWLRASELLGPGLGRRRLRRADLPGLAGYGMDAWVGARRARRGRRAPGGRREGRRRAPARIEASRGTTGWLTAQRRVRQRRPREPLPHRREQPRPASSGLRVARRMVSASAARSAQRLAIYAHGGLNSRRGSGAAHQLDGAVLHSNGGYPVFLIWRTGPPETLSGILDDARRRCRGRRRRRPVRAEETAAGSRAGRSARPAAKPIWSRDEGERRAAHSSRVAAAGCSPTRSSSS